MKIDLAIRLLQEACALYHTALNTEKSYVRCARQYARFLQCSHPKPLLTTEAKIEAFLTSLALKEARKPRLRSFCSGLRGGRIADQASLSKLRLVKFACVSGAAMNVL